MKLSISILLTFLTTQLAVAQMDTTFQIPNYSRVPTDCALVPISLEARWDSLAHFLDSTKWKMPWDRKRFHEIRELALNDSSGDVYATTIDFPKRFVVALNEQMDVSKLYLWDAQYAYCEKQKQVAKVNDESRIIHQHFADTTDLKEFSPFAKLWKLEGWKDTVKVDQNWGRLHSKLREIYEPGYYEEEYIAPQLSHQWVILNADTALHTLHREEWYWGGVFYFKDGVISITRNKFEGLKENYKLQGQKFKSNE